MKTDTNDFIRLVQNASNESDAYKRQLHIWLGVGSAGGAISMMSWAASMPDPAFIFVFLQLSLWSFLIGVLSAGASIFFLSLRSDAMGAHFAAAHNRNHVNDTIRGIPEVVSSPRRIADEANHDRNGLIAKSHQEHERAERAWTLKQRFSAAWGTCMALSALAFAFGFAWPLVQVSFLGARLVP